MISASAAEHCGIGKLAQYTAVILAIAIMVPRLLSAQFGLFDDGVTISVAEQVAQGGSPLLGDIGHGRTRPVYWLFNSLLYILFGPQPLGFFLANAVLLLGLTATLVWLVRESRRDPLEAGLAGLLFVLSGPVIECFYTLSKPEPLQLALLGISLMAMVRAVRQRSAWRRFAWGIASTGCLVTAGLTKETGVVMVGVAGIWFLLSGRRSARMSVWAWRGITGGLLVASLVGLLTYLGARMWVAGSLWPLTGYAAGFQPSLSRLMSSLVRLGAWLLRDFGFLLAMAGAVLLIRTKSARFDADCWRLAWLAWALAWLAPYLGWVYAVEYYLLPVAWGLAIAGASLAAELLRWQRTNVVWQRVMAGLGLAIALLMFGFLQAGNWSNARLQLLVDSVNSEMVEILARSVPAEATVWVNLEPGSEYVEEIALHLALLHERPDVRVMPLAADAGSPPSSAGKAYVVSPKVEHQFLLSVRMGVYESEDSDRRRLLESVLGQGAKPVQVVEGQMRNLVLDYSALLMGTRLASAVCERFHFQKYCQQGAPFLDTRLMTYGWEIYQQSAGQE